MAFLLGVVGAAAWAAPAHSNVPDSGIRGVVLDTTCYGPCQVGQDPGPYEGGGLTVAIRRISTGELVRRLTPEHGRFSPRIRPGAYRVIARVAGECWEGEAKRVGVKAHEFARVELHVGNTCIV